MNSSGVPSVVLRPVKSWEEYLAAEALQRVVWQMPDWRDVVPANLLITIQKNGGLVLGAFETGPHERLVGFAFSFVGIDHGPAGLLSKQCSHMLAVLPEYQARQIGARLKLLQRELTLAQNLPLITWTYDPLLALNASLNLVRLGAVARRYVSDAYGAMTDGLNAGLPSDRFEVEWWLRSARATACAAGPAGRADWSALVAQGARELFTVRREEGLPILVDEHDLRGDCLLVEIPFDLAALKSRLPAAALAWRMRTRAVFQRAFAAGYVAYNLVTTAGPERRAAYVLTRDPVETGL